MASSCGYGEGAGQHVKSGGGGEGLKHYACSVNGHWVCNCISPEALALLIL